jgi:ABC-type dipeptide/oligopeptide/nickel transport system permease subunit
MGDDNMAKKKGQGRQIWRRLKKNRLSMFGLITLIIIVLAAIFADFIAPYPYDLQNYSVAKQFPSLEHPFGTDNYGRDIFSRVIYGTRVSLQIGFISLSAGALIGTISLVRNLLRDKDYIWCIFDLLFVLVICLILILFRKHRIVKYLYFQKQNLTRFIFVYI